MFFSGLDIFPHRPLNSAKPLKETQSTDPNQENDPEVLNLIYRGKITDLFILVF